jgi:hypothetical protein
MLIVTWMLIVPNARRKGISHHNAILLALAMWACSLLVAWICIRSRRRRFTHGKDRHTTTYTDYSESVEHSHDN